MPRVAPEQHFDHSGGVQAATSWLMRAQNEVEDAVNARFDDEIGVITRRNGYVQEGSTVQADKLGRGLHEAKFSTGARFFAACNNAGDTETIIKYRNVDGTWSNLTLPYTIPASSVIQFTDSLDEMYIAGRTAAGDPLQVINVKKDLTTSITRNLLFAPKGSGVIEYANSLYVTDVQVAGVNYRDRAYKSSPALSVITYVRGDQTDVAAPTTLLDNIPTMTSNTTPQGVASASSTFTGYQPYWAFDDNTTRNTGTWFSASGTNTGWIKYDFGVGNAKIITYYSLKPVPSDASAGDAESAPKTWTFEGSNDDATWTVIDTKTNQPGWGTQEKRTYPVTNTTAYRYYRVNVSLTQWVGAAQNLLMINEVEMLTSGVLTKPLVMKIDTVRYIKPGMSLDVYKKNTTVKRFTLTVDTVDKLEDTFTFQPFSYTITTSNVNTATDVITLPDTTNFQTGQTIKFDSSGTVPAGLTADTIYYAINLSSTTIKVATTLDNATVGVGIDLTSTGTGSIRVRTSYVVADNDEIYLNGRYGELYYLWNTDYPTADKAEFLKIPSGASANSRIVGYGKSNNRLFLWTDTTMHRWDQSQLITLYDDIGCANQDTIVNIGDWLLWLDTENRVIARNDSTGQQEFISKAVKKKYLQFLPTSNYPECAAGRVDNVYKLHIGQVTLADGSTQIIRLCYDFDSNTWTRENHMRKILQCVTSNLGGFKRIFFLDDTGKFYRDGEGDLDDADTIPFLVKFGRNNSGSIMQKQYSGFYVIGRNISGASVRMYMDNKPDPIEVGTCKDNYSEVRLGNKNVSGRDFTLEIALNAKGSPPAIEGYVPFLGSQEENFG